ncbi:hypothetical protein PV325_012299 [Microctonus aethiopoides]|nr:hypothetical protein PV325_012299 [Microctonus aethiopoides]
MTDRDNTFGQPSAGADNDNNQVNEIPPTYTLADVAKLLRTQIQIHSFYEETYSRQDKLETLLTDFEIDVEYDATPNEIADKYEKITEEFECIKDYQKTIDDLTAKHKILFEKLEAQCADSNALHNNIPTQNNSRQQVPVPAPRTSMPSVADSDPRENLNTTLDRHAKINNKKISNTTNDKNKLSKIIQTIKRKKRSLKSKKFTYYRKQKEIKKRSGQTKRNASKLFGIKNRSNFQTTSRHSKYQLRRYHNIYRTSTSGRILKHIKYKTSSKPRTYRSHRTYAESTERPNDMIKRGPGRPYTISQFTNS